MSSKSKDYKEGYKQGYRDGYDWCDKTWKENLEKRDGYPTAKISKDNGGNVYLTTTKRV